MKLIYMYGGLLSCLLLISACQQSTTSSDVLSVVLAAGEGESPFGHNFMGMSPYDSSGVEDQVVGDQPLTGVPDSLMDLAIYTENLQTKQNIYYEFHAGLMDSSRYQRFLDEGYIKEENYTTEFVDQQIHIATGLAKDSSFVFVFDTDNDEDFGDEEAIILPRDNPTGSWLELDVFLPNVEIEYEAFDGEQIVVSKTRVSVNPYIDLPPGMLKQGMKKPTFIGGRGYRTGYLEYEGQRYAWWVADPGSTGEFTERGTRAWVEPINRGEEIRWPREQERLLEKALKDTSLGDQTWPDGSFPRLEEPYEIGDLLILGNEYFALEEVSQVGDYLTLRRTEGNAIGLRTGLEAPDFEAMSIDSTTVRLLDYRGKYVLIDFWGTWCAPCIAEVPHLVDAYESYSREDFDILAIANDNAESVREYIEKEDLSWVQIIQQPGDSTGTEILDLYRIIGYPTTYLIGPNGIVLERESALRGTDLKETLAKYIQEAP